MSTIYATAAEAISASIARNEITRCERTYENIADLSIECDEDADGEELEFWGADVAGNEWRVHVVA